MFAICSEKKEKTSQYKGVCWHRDTGKWFVQLYLKEGKKKYGEPHYRLLKKQYNEENNGNWVLLPLYPYNPYEDVISEKDEQFFDLNSKSIR